MNVSEQTLQQIERALRKAASKFPAEADSLPLTDIYLQVKQDSGELLIFNDDDVELTRCVVEEWIGNSAETFYDDVRPVLQQALTRAKDVTEHFAVLRPYSFVLTGEDGEMISELYLVDDETILLDGHLMDGLDDDLNRFFDELMRG